MNLARLALLLSLLALLVLLIGGPGYRLGLWGLGFGLLGVMRYALILGAIGALAALVQLLLPRFRRGRSLPLAVALVLGLVVVAVPLSVRQTAERLPMIHDISTDTEDPPAFVEIAPLRADAPNPVAYAGAETAAAQRAGYPDLETAHSELAPAALFEHALAAARAMGWEIVAHDQTAGRIEASTTTFWYGFVDDIVIRIRPSADGSALDIRSKSRVGRSDLGANAARIRAFLERLQPHWRPAQ
ncbi:MAG: DUF1499 domain-containing protein [Wenzhouxiangellaceae bacterium]|nr:DUF1499 domain-containing protein [Wenzhouxiangellaceae bacterium]